MDLIPRPDQLVAASANVAQKVLYGGVADLRPMPRTLIDEGTLREVYHYRPMGTAKQAGDPVLLVTPLAAPATCYDLRRGCSVVEHLVSGGRPTYLVEYGNVSFRDRNLGMEHWVTEVVPEAIRQVSRHAGDRPVHVVGWSVGGLFALLTAASQPQLPIATVTTLGAPIDVTQVPLIAPLRPFLGVGGDKAAPIALAYRIMGGMPKPVVRRAFQLTSFNKVFSKPFVQLAKLDDTEFLAQVEAVDRFTRSMIAYPGRSFGQLYHRLVRGNELATGVVHFNGTDVRLADLRVPVLAFGGANDSIAPVNCVRPIENLLPHVADFRFEVVPGGHLGMLTGRAARRTTWPILDEFIDAHSSAAAAADVAPEKPPAKKPPAKKRPAKKEPAKTPGGKKPAVEKPAVKKPAVEKPAVKKAPRKRPATGEEPSAIGTNPRRRYSSAQSRDLSTARPRPRAEG